MYRILNKNSINLKRSLAQNFINQYRSVSYTLPIIPNLESIKLSEKNFSGLYSNKTVEELWFKRGQELINGLNQLLEEHQILNPPQDLNELITLTFNKPEFYGIYSYASLLHNLQFYLENLKPNDSGIIKFCDEFELLKNPDLNTQISNQPKDEQLKNWIIDSFGSLSEFKTLLLNSAKGIKGDGIVWLVAQASRSDSNLNENNAYNQIDSSSSLNYNTLSIMNTYNAGIVDDSIRSGQISKLKEEKIIKIASLKKKQEERKKIIQENGESEELSNIEDIEFQKHLELSSIPSDLILGSIEEAEFSTLYSDRKLLPVLAIDASMRNYLLDYGVFGKQQYLDNVWNCINWDVVAKRLPPRFKTTVEF